MPYAPNIVFRMRWFAGLLLGAFIAFPLMLPGTPPVVAPAPSSAPAPAQTAVAPALAAMAARTPGKRVEVIVQLQAGTKRAAAAPLVRELGGRVTRDLHIINAVVAKLPAGGATELAARPGIRAVSLNGMVKPQGVGDLVTSFNSSIQSHQLWTDKILPATGKGIGVAVIDTGIAGDLPDFRVSSSDRTSRVIGSAVVHPDAVGAGDSYGHGTHVAGIIAGDSNKRASTDPLRSRYSGVAPDANLISIKASDEQGNSTILDVIYGIQFAVDHRDEYNIRVLNLSLESTVSESYKTDPLDAAVESAWLKGIVVVAAAGN